jgi:CrcB protein
MSLPRMSFTDTLLIALGGILGSLLRTFLEAGFSGDFPVPTLWINILGAAALGLLHARQHRVHPSGRYLYAVGFCGSFTTVSLFSWETFQLMHAGQWGAGLLNIGIPVITALALVFVIVRQFDQPGGERRGP